MNILNIIGRIGLWIILRNSPVSQELPSGFLWHVDPFNAKDASKFIDSTFNTIPENIIVDLCLVESGGCRAIAIHNPNSPHTRALGRHAWAAAHDSNKLNSRCMWHRFGRARRWSTRGSHGQIAAYGIDILGCTPPELLDIPLISAYVAARRIEKICRGRRNTRKSCTSNDVRIAWAGKKKDPEKVIERWETRVKFWRGTPKNANIKLTRSSSAS